MKKSKSHADIYIGFDTQMVKIKNEFEVKAIETTEDLSHVARLITKCATHYFVRGRAHSVGQLRTTINS